MIETGFFREDLKPIVLHHEDDDNNDNDDDDNDKEEDDDNYNILKFKFIGFGT